MKRVILTTLLLLPFIAWNAKAQNDSAAQKKDTLLIRYLVTSDFTFTLGNLVSFTTINKGQLELEKKVIGFKFNAAYRYGTIDTTVNSNELNLSAFISLFPKNRVYGFVNGGFETSFLRGINYRGYGGVGAGFRVVKTESHEFEPYINFLYEYNRYVDPIPTDTVSPYELQTFRGVVGWTGLHKFVKNKLVITHYFKYQQSLQIMNNFRFEGAINIQYPIIKILAVRAGFTGTYENVVPIGRKQADFLWTIGLSLSNL